MEGMKRETRSMRCSEWSRGPVEARLAKLWGPKGGTRRVEAPEWTRMKRGTRIPMVFEWSGEPVGAILAKLWGLERGTRSVGN